MDPKWQTFANQIKPAAQDLETRTGIPWTFAMVQAGHESRHGESQLTRDANNLFGITGDTWAQEGKPVYIIRTIEYAANGLRFEIKRPFRKYANWQESLNDWADLLERRYPKAITAAKAGDFKGFAQALQEGGYATDPHYAEQLVALHSTLRGIA